MDEILTELYAVIEDRKRETPDGSYTAQLLTDPKGEDAVLEKLGEEVTETILAVKNGEDEEIVHEAADIVYHLLVVLAMEDIGIEPLRDELAERRSS